MFVDPGAKELIDRLSARVALLEHQVQTLLAHLAFDPGAPPLPSRAPEEWAAPTVTDEVMSLVRAGKIPRAINAYRQYTGSDLRTAKEEIDRLRASLE